MTQPTSICMLSVHTCPVAALGGKKTGGMNVYVRDLARQLGSRGIKVDIFTRCQSQDSAEVKRLGPNVQTIHIPSGPEKELSPAQIYPHLDEFAQNVLNFAKKAKTKYNLIHSHYWLSGLVALKLRQSWHMPILQTFHTLQLVKNLFSPLHQPNEPVRLIRPIHRQKSSLSKPEITKANELKTRIKAETELVKQVDWILGFTPDEKEHLINLYQAKKSQIKLIPPGVDTDRFKPIPAKTAKAKIGILPTHKLLLFVGRLDPIKNLETLLQALGIILKGPTLQALQDRPLCLAIIGGEKRDAYLGRVKTLAQKLGIYHVTTFLGSQDQRVLPYYYSAAEMTIVPSSYESFGLVALESMACATPVLASKVGGLEYLVKNKRTGFLVPPDEPKSLAKCIEILLKDKKLRKEMGVAAQKHAQKYAWQKITPKILKLYSHLID